MLTIISLNKDFLLLIPTKWEQCDLRIAQLILLKLYTVIHILSWMDANWQKLPRA